MSVIALIANLVVILTAFVVVMRWNPPNWWQRLGVWLFAQAKGPQAENMSRSCWKRVVPESLARWLGKLLSLRVNVGWGVVEGP